jgi:hypothetical protein
MEAPESGIRCAGERPHFTFGDLISACAICMIGSIGRQRLILKNIDTEEFTSLGTRGCRIGYHGNGQEDETTSA